MRNPRRASCLVRRPAVLFRHSLNELALNSRRISLMTSPGVSPNCLSMQSNDVRSSHAICIIRSRSESDRGCWTASLMNSRSSDIFGIRNSMKTANEVRCTQTSRDRRQSALLTSTASETALSLHGRAHHERQTTHTARKREDERQTDSG